MTQPSPLVHFEVLADEPERAVRFYAGVFGWHIAKWSNPEADSGATRPDYWIIYTGRDERAIHGGLSKRAGERPAQQAPINAFVCTMHVTNMHQTLSDIKEYGGQVTTDSMRSGGGLIAYATDTEGNSFCIMQTEAEQASSK